MRIAVANCSTNLCSMASKETLTHYAHNHAPVFRAFLDITKAFDKLNYCRLFRFHIKRNIPPYALALIVVLLTHA
jgi:hypothetical protein